MDHNPEMPEAIRLVDQENILTHILSKFGELRLKTVQVRERTKRKCFFLLIQGTLLWSCWIDLADYQTWPIYFTTKRAENV